MSLPYLIGLVFPSTNAVHKGRNLGMLPVLSHAYSFYTTRSKHSFCIQSTRFILPPPRDEPTLEWCLIGDDGLDVERPALLMLSKGAIVIRLSSSYLGVNPLSIVVLSKLAMLIGGGRFRFRSCPL